MADKAATPTEVETTPEVCEKVEKTKPEEKPAAEESKAKNGEAENGATEKTEAENGEEETDKKNGSDDTDKCCIKRKSTGGDATEDTPAEGATPEKKAKLSEPAEETKEAEVSA